MITSNDNQTLKTIRKLQRRDGRERSGLFTAEGEDLVAAAAAAGIEPKAILRAGIDVEEELLDRVSTLGSGSRVIGVYEQRWSKPGGTVCLYVEGVRDPGNVGTTIRSAHALCDGPVVLGEGCADPYSPKAVRASMGSVFARPPARAGLGDLGGTSVALAAGRGTPLHELQFEPPLVLCVGGERSGLSKGALAAADVVAHLPLRKDGPESLNVAMAATVALYEVNRMARHV